MFWQHVLPPDREFDLILSAAYHCLCSLRTTGGEPRSHLGRASAYLGLAWCDGVNDVKTA